MIHFLYTIKQNKHIFPANISKICMTIFFFVLSEKEKMK